MLFNWQEKLVMSNDYWHQIMFNDSAYLIVNF